MEREMEIKKAQQTPTDELFGQMIMSFFLKNWHFNEYQYRELAVRAGFGTSRILIGTGVGLAKGTGEAGKGVVKSILS
jgi:hypothetical protein